MTSSSRLAAPGIARRFVPLLWALLAQGAACHYPPDESTRYVTTPATADETCIDSAVHEVTTEPSCSERAPAACAPGTDAESAGALTLRRMLDECFLYENRLQVELEQGCATRFGLLVEPPGSVDCIMGYLAAGSYDCLGAISCGVLRQKVVADVPTPRDRHLRVRWSVNEEDGHPRVAAGLHRARDDGSRRESLGMTAHHLRREESGRLLSVDDARWLGSEIRRFSATRSAAFLRAGLAYAMTGAQEAFARGTSDLGEAALSAEVRRCMTLLEEEPALSRRDLADHAGADPDALSHAFKRELGVGLVTYRNRVRVRRFLELATSGRQTLLAACLEAGFGSYPQFHRVFVAETGQTPRDYLAAR